MSQNKNEFLFISKLNIIKTVLVFMKTFLFTQKDALFLITEDAWKKHLNMVRLTLFQEDSLADVLLVLADYDASFEKRELGSELVHHYKNQYGIEVNTSRQLESIYGSLIHF